MKTKYILSFMLLGFLSACDNALDIEPEFAQDAESYFNTDQDYELALIGAYDLLQTSYATLWIGEIASDNSIAGGESVNDTRALHEIDEMTHNPVSDILQAIMRFNYAGITRVNYIMEFRDKLDFDRKAELIAEARFLRAYYYMELVKVFGDMPLIVDERLGFSEATSVERSPVADVYVQIEEDLIAAAADLEWTSSEKGRATKGAALSLLGKAYLYQEKFTEAANTLDEVIQMGPYDTIQVSTSDEYADLFSPAGESNEESVFEIQYSGLEGGGYDCFVCLEGNLAVGFHSPKNYEGPVYANGNAYNQPTKELYDAYDASDLRRDGSILDMVAWETANPGVTYAQGAGGWTGYYNNKYMRRLGEGGIPDAVLTSPRNHRVIRYPDVLLMAAEAHNRKATADDAQAQTYLNMVRDRVGMLTITATGTALRDAIWAERRYELAGEGHRFFDLVRTGEAADAITDFVVGKHELFPIPQVEIDLAGGNWQQNPEY